MLVVNATKIKNKTRLTVVPHVCGICKKAFLQERSLLEHFKSHDVKTWESFESKTELTDSTKRDCNINKKINESFTVDSKLHDNDGLETNVIKKKLHTCEICHRNFSSRNYLYKHIMLHKGDRSYECGVCHKSFVLRENLVKHSLTHDPDKKRYFCLDCGKGFTSRQYKEKHELIHLGEKPHICHVCKKAFTLKSNLNKHILIHSEERLRFSCGECGKGFSSKAYLEKHHFRLGEPFECGVCHKAFTSNSYLQRHYLTHKGKRYDCGVCCRRFKSKDALEKHTKVHVLRSDEHEDLFKCLLCSFVSGESTDMEEHLQTHAVISDGDSCDMISFKGDCVGVSEITSENEDCDDPCEESLNP